MDDFITWSAAAMARAARAGEVSCRELAEAHVARCEALASLKAIVAPRFEEALAEAAALDAARARGEPLGPLAGVPCTIKDCFHLPGLPTTLGLPARGGHRDEDEAAVVAWMRRAGAIVLGKTNVPQLMLFMECDNPLYGRTDNPWNRDRTPGGSSGGDAAAVAAGGTAIGLGSDLGGSIRVPAHFCGVAGFKPTAGSLPMTGSDTSLPGFEAINSQPGPLARTAEDLALWWRVMQAAAAESIHQERPRPGPNGRDLAGCRFACWEEDEVFRASPAVRRAVREAAAVLEERGLVRVDTQPPEIGPAFDLYIALCTAGGDAAWRALLAGSEVDRRISRLCLHAGLSFWLRPLATWIMHLQGERRLARMVAEAGPRSAAGLAELVERRQRWRRRVETWFAHERIDLVLSPVFATPAIRHGDGPDLLPAAASTLYVNLLGLPSASVPVTRVRPDEEPGRPPPLDTADRKAVAADEASAGLPVGVQLSAPWWQDDFLLAAASLLEECLRTRADYPRTPVLTI